MLDDLPLPPQKCVWSPNGPAHILQLAGEGECQFLSQHLSRSESRLTMSVLVLRHSDHAHLHGGAMRG